MRTLLTVGKAKKKIEELQHYVAITESYKPETIELRVIKEYAYTSSRKVVVENLNALGFEYNGRQLEQQDVTNIIKSKTMDELHRLVKIGFLKKTKAHRKRAAEEKAYRSSRIVNSNL